jgi:hypothetical protein
MEEGGVGGGGGGGAVFSFLLLYIKYKHNGLGVNATVGGFGWLVGC